MIAATTLNVSHVLHHLRNMHDVYNDVKDLGVVDLYVYFSDMEKKYVFEGEKNYAMIVHQLSPINFQTDNAKGKLMSVKGQTDRAIKDRMICPYCSTSLPSNSAYSIHIKHGNVTCSNCREVITYEAFVLATFVRNFNRGDYPTVAINVQLIFDKNNATWKAFSSYLLQLFKANDKIISSSSVQAQRRQSFNLRKEIRGIIAAVRNNISCLSMDLIQGMYRQLLFINKICGNYICSNYEYWIDPKIIEASIERYHKFLNLIAIHNRRSYKVLVPTMDIDLIWHTHQTNHNGYYQYTNSLLGKVLNHNDNIGTDNLKKGKKILYVYKWLLLLTLLSYKQ
jgi:hypothetical protein